MSNNTSLMERVFIWICILLPVMRIIKLIPELPTPVYYGTFALLGVGILLDKTKKINWTVVLFLIVCFLSIIGNDIPAYFHSYERFAGMMFIMLCVGPLFYSEWTCRMRIYSLKYISWVLIGISMVSFLLYVIYRPITITERGNLFGGITVHSMIMGPIAALSVLYIIQYLQFEKNKLNRTIQLLLWIICFICFLAAILAGSRAALLSLLGALTVWSWLYFRNIKKFIRYTVGVSLVVCISFPLWWQYTEAIQEKMKYAESKGTFIASREGKWEERIKEFKDNPFLGCGFCAVKTNISTTAITAENEGIVEPGNGWLFMLSSTGIFSFILFFFHLRKDFIPAISN